jgi:poly[(R)-3-hydroxyalkanoate] polymerase subunit PhaC
MYNPVPLEYATSFSQTRQAMMQQFATGLLTSGDNATDFMRYSELASVQQNYLLEMGALWMDSLMGSDPEQPAKGDRRFAGEEWKKSPYHEFLKQSYLVNARYVGDLIERASLDDRTRARMHFFARQILDVLSPSNHLTTNPQVIRRAMETGGDSLATGVKNLLEDLGKGRISMTDEQAFEVGRNLALTPGSVVFENELIQLIQYQPLTEAVGKRPLVLFPPSINKFYVFDLQPANSFICYAVEQGNTVFVVSWRNVMAEQGHLTWDDYFNEGIMRAIDVALEITGADKVNALGFCVGGTMLGCAAAVMAARREDKIESLTFLTTMLDFTQAGEIALLIDEQSVAAREQTIDGGGILPGRELAFVFSTLRGNDLIWPYVVGNYLEGRQPDAFDILYWNADSTNLPGPIYCWYVRNTYLENNLRGPGANDAMRGQGRPVGDRRTDLCWRIARITSCRRRPPTEPRNWCRATCVSCSERAVTSPASSTRQRATSATTGSKASRENDPRAGRIRRATCREAGGRTGAPGFVFTPARRCGHARAWAAPRFPRSRRRPAATSRCAPPEPDLETRGGKS